MADARVAVIVLAAGASTRMGEPKLLLPIDRDSLLRRAATRALASGATSVLVVLPPDAPAWRSALDGLAVTLVDAPSLGGPVSGSLHAALDRLDDGIGAVLVVLADMVHVTSAMMASVIGAGGAAPCRLVGSTYGGVVAPPLLIPRRHLAELRGKHGDGIGRALFAAHADESVSVRWPETALHDVDTPEDYRAVRSPE